MQELQNHLQRLELDFVRAETQLTGFRKKEELLKKELNTALLYLSVRDEVKEDLAALNESAHRKVTSGFERLLSAICKDVIGPAAYPIKLELDVSKNNSNLEILADNGGNLESVFESNGGAMTNLVCTGLRLGALARYPLLRKFIVLDEVDCWIRAHNMPAFMATINEACKKLNVQALYISHHQPEYFPMDVGLFEIGSGSAKVLRAPVPFENESEKGIRKIQMTNFRAHKELTLALGKGLIGLTGPINVGKSHIGAAFRAIGQGVSTDRDIHHEESSYELEVEIEGGVTIQLVRYLKKSPKMVWTVIQADGSSTEYLADGRGAAPEVVQKLLGLHVVEDMNIQLHNQKTPVFLLDEPASQQAKILSLGKESSFIQKMLEAQERALKEHRVTKVRCEEKLETLRKVLDTPDQCTVDLELEDLRFELDTYRTKMASIKKRHEDLNSLKSLQKRLVELNALSELEVPPVVEALSSKGLEAVEKLQSIVARLQAIEEALALEVPSLTSAAVRSKCANIGSVTQIRDRLESLGEVPLLLNELPGLEALSKRAQTQEKSVSRLLKDKQSLSEVSSRLCSAEEFEQIEIQAKELEVKFESLRKLDQALKGLGAQSALTEKKDTLMAQIEKADLALSQTQKQLDLAQEELKSLISETGGICPLCNSHFEKDHVHAA